MSLPNFLQSSDGSGDLSLRVKSFLVGLVPLAVFVSAALGHPLTTESLNGLVNDIVNIASALTLIGAAVAHVVAWKDANFRKQAGLGKFAPSVPVDSVLPPKA